MLGNTVREHRRRLGLSQEELAFKARISARAVRKIESYETDKPRPATVRLLADAFELVGAERERFCQLALGTPIVIEPLPPVQDPPPVASRLIGRDAELATLRTHAATAAAGGGSRLVWITGETGLGKTALSAELAAVLRHGGWSVVMGGVPPYDIAPPGWAWVGLLRGLLDIMAGPPGADDPLIARGRALLLRADDEREPGVAPFPLARAITDLLRRCSQSGPVLIGLDDAHLADQETLQILRYAHTELAGRRLLFVVTADPTQLAPALDTTRAALAGPRADELRLDGLTEPEVGRLLATHCPLRLPPELVGLVSDRTAGNPLFVEAVARLIAEEGISAAADRVPRAAELLLRRQLALLTPQAQDVLRTVATFGREVSLDVLLALDPGNADAVLAGLEAAIRVGLLDETPEGTIRFVTALIHDAVQQDVPGTRRARLHAQVVAGLERTRVGVVAVARHARTIPDGGRAVARAAEALNAHLRALEAVVLATVNPLIQDDAAPVQPIHGRLTAAPPSTLTSPGARAPSSSLAAARSRVS